MRRRTAAGIAALIVGAGGALACNGGPANATYTLEVECQGSERRIEISWSIGGEQELDVIRCSEKTFRKTQELNAASPGYMAIAAKQPTAGKLVCRVIKDGQIIQTDTLSTTGTLKCESQGGGDGF